MGQGGFGHHQQAAGVLIQAVHQAGAAHFADLLKLRAVVQEGVQQGAAPVPGPGMDHQPRGLVERQQVPVLIEDLQGQGLGGEGAGRRRRHPHGDRFSSPHPVGGGFCSPVDLNQPGFEKFLQAGP